MSRCVLHKKYRYLQQFVYVLLPIFGKFKVSIADKMNIFFGNCLYIPINKILKTYNSFYCVR